MNQETESLLDTGSWVGRQQAFAVIANRCSAAQALCLKQMKESGCYDAMGLSWEEFCEKFVGLSHRQANRIISQYNEFGEAYFRLSNLARISPEDYREIAPAIDGNSVEIDGQSVTLVPENAARIRAFIKKCKSARPPAPPADAVTPYDIGNRLKQVIVDAHQCAGQDLSPNDYEYLQRVVGYAVQEWVEIGRCLDGRRS